VYMLIKLLLVFLGDLNSSSIEELFHFRVSEIAGHNEFRILFAS
jgi:hypothetical protein